MKKNYVPVLHELTQTLRSAAVGNEQAIEEIKSLTFHVNQEELASEALQCLPPQTLNPEP